MKRLSQPLAYGAGSLVSLIALLARNYSGRIVPLLLAAVMVVYGITALGQLIATVFSLSEKQCNYLIGVCYVVAAGPLFVIGFTLVLLIWK